MKLSAYIVKYDCGFAPNPFGGYCTLACCKPTIRRYAKVGDIIAGTASARLPPPGRLIYAMRVAEVLPYETYWERFPDRRPSGATAISRRGDNIWHLGPNNEWEPAPDGVHDESHREKDTSGENALIATEFYYFGREVVTVPHEFTEMLAKTQGYKNTDNRALIERFWDWLHTKYPRQGLIANPSEFDDASCRARCVETEDDNVEECRIANQALSLDPHTGC